ncbi:MAG TPA: flagellar M-ring protein FliF C-terminal domain-containing protein, partial [Bryobacteraceae bacterium]|nr:flagellar M-ring protein FliF C-terminal domain-containing protein [Bryobacteraceae bacterium]
VDCDFTTTEQSEEVYDPTRSVMVNSQVSEDSTGAIQTAGIPGTQANSARPPAKPAQAPSGLSRRTENVTYDTTRTVRHIKVPQGAIKRISASVLLDEMVQWKGTGKKRQRVLIPIPADQMSAIRDLVSGTLGLVKDRDQLVLESLPFEQTISGGSLEGVAMPEAPAQPLSLLNNRRIYIGAGAGLALLLGTVAIMLLKRRGKKAELTQAPRALTPVAANVQPVTDVANQALQPQEQPVAINHQLPPVAKKVEAVRDHLRDSVKRDPVFAANVLRGWLEEDAAKVRERSA